MQFKILKQKGYVQYVFGLHSSVLAKCWSWRALRATFLSWRRGCLLNSGLWMSFVCLSSPSLNRYETVTIDQHSGIRNIITSRLVIFVFIASESDLFGWSQTSKRKAPRPRPSLSQGLQTNTEHTSCQEMALSISR